MSTTDHTPKNLIHYEVVNPDHASSPLKLHFQFAHEKPSLGDPGSKPGDLILEKEGDSKTLIVSLGLLSKATSDAFRKAGGSIGSWLVDHHASAVDLSMDSVNQPEVPGAVQALFEGIILGSYHFKLHKKQEKETLPVTIFIQTRKDTVTLQTLVDQVMIIAEAVLLAREWSQEPANIINPPILAERTAALAAQSGLKCTILDETQLADIKAGAILAVGNGSQTPPRLIVLEYPGTDKQAKPIVLVGKALTFDSGGYSIKNTDNIQGMKYDKCGGVTVIATLQAVARLGLKTPVIGIISAAENMISDTAYRPDDIITTLSGKTVEIVTTDAEGRLVLADALTYAQQHYTPQSIIDLATLTGGVVTALGRIRAGIMSNNPDLVRTLSASGDRTWERLWELPLDDEYLIATKGDDADLKNSGGREGHAIMGGIFLKQFVDDSIPWAHLDIAGVADTPKDLPYCHAGATGFGIRLLIDYLQNLSN